MLIYLVCWDGLYVLVQELLNIAEYGMLKIRMTCILAWYGLESGEPVNCIALIQKTDIFPVKKFTEHLRMLPKEILGGSRPNIIGSHYGGPGDNLHDFCLMECCPNYNICSPFLILETL